MLPDLSTWRKRKFGCTTYQLAQAVIGHGYFQEHLCGFGKVSSSECALCLPVSADSAKHALMECDYFHHERQELHERTGRLQESKDITAAMLGSEAGWLAVERFAANVTRAKEASERTKERRTGRVQEPE